MTRHLSLEGDVTIRGPSGTGRVRADGGRVEVALGWRFLLAVVRDGRFRRAGAATARFLRIRGVRLFLRLPGLPPLSPSALAVLVSGGLLLVAAAVATPFLLS